MRYPIHIGSRALFDPSAVLRRRGLYHQFLVLLRRHAYHCPAPQALVHSDCVTSEIKRVSSAISSLLYSDGVDKTKETKQGSYIYTGDAASFHEWEFRTLLRVKGKKADAYIETASKVVDGPRGDAFVIAREVGREDGSSGGPSGRIPFDDS